MTQDITYDHPFHGVLPALLTPFTESGEIDRDELAEDARRLLCAGCEGIVWAGSMGEGQRLSPRERSETILFLRETLGTAATIIAAVSATSTRDAVTIAGNVREHASGLMVLPPLVYAGRWSGVIKHVESVADAAPDLPLMYYNNPAYRAASVQQLEELCTEVPPIKAIKQADHDPNAIAALLPQMHSDTQVLVGLDQNLYDGMMAGASGWVAGLAVAMPGPCIELYRMLSDARNARSSENPDADDIAERALQLHTALLPMFLLDATPDLTAYYKFLRQRVVQDNSPCWTRFREPNLPLTTEQEVKAAAMYAVFERWLQARGQS